MLSYSRTLNFLLFISEISVKRSLSWSHTWWVNKGSYFIDFNVPVFKKLSLYFSFRKKEED